MKYRWGRFLGYNVLFPNLKISFKKRDEIGERDCCVYLWMYKGRIFYIGEGLNNRPFTHSDDALSLVIDSDWTVIIVAYNITKMEACIIESKLLSLVENRSFMKRGQYEWDGVSLLNKQRERKYRGVPYEYLFEEYLNLDNWNNYWEAFRREINGY